MTDLVKYVRTPHLAGSRLQPGDNAEGQIDLADLPSGEQVWEEKLDGGNTGISFSADADLLLQSRGHYLTGGPREEQYALLKRWANRHIEFLFDALGARYVMYGEWCYAKHTVFYDLLPHYFLEFDIYDRETACFLSTPARRTIIGGEHSPVVSVPVLHTGRLARRSDMLALIRPSLFKSEDWKNNFRQAAQRIGYDLERALNETEDSDLSEGLYLKVEQGDHVVGRYKYVRQGFLQRLLAADSHWASRWIIPNQLAPRVVL